MFIFCWTGTEVSHFQPSPPCLRSLWNHGFLLSFLASAERTRQGKRSAQWRGGWRERGRAGWRWRRWTGPDPGLHLPSPACRVFYGTPELSWTCRESSGGDRRPARVRYEPLQVTRTLPCQRWVNLNRNFYFRPFAASVKAKGGLTPRCLAFRPLWSSRHLGSSVWTDLLSTTGVVFWKDQDNYWKLLK